MPRVKSTNLKDNAPSEEGKPMAPKTLEADSKYAAYDTDGDGIVSDEELEMAEKIADLEAKKAKEKDRDMREDAQRRMAWFALFGMLLYPFSVVLASIIGVDQAAEILGSMASVYFVSVAAIVAAFYGSQAYTSAQNNNNNEEY